LQRTIIHQGAPFCQWFEAIKFQPQYTEKSGLKKAKITQILVFFMFEFCTVAKKSAAEKQLIL
jgi:hypothetical protein